MEESLHLKGEFVEAECDRFRQLCNFTDDERAVFDLRVKGKSIVEISMTPLANPIFSEPTISLTSPFLAGLKNMA